MAGFIPSGLVEHDNEQHEPDMREASVPLTSVPAGVAGDGEIVFYDDGTIQWATTDEAGLSADDHDHTGDVINPDEAHVEDVIGNAVYPTIDDVPAEYEEKGNMAYTESDGLVVFDT